MRTGQPYYKIVNGRHFLSLMIFLFATELCAQSLSYFNNQYNFHTSGELSLGVVSANDYYYTCGNGTDTSGEMKIDLSCIDTAGNLLWTKTYGQPSCSYYCGGSAAMIATVDGGFAMAGTLQSNGRTQALLMKFDGNGDTLWTKIFGNDSACFAYQCKQTSDNGYIIVGGTDYTDYWVDVLLIKTDSLGNETWRTTYGNTNQEIGLTVVQTFDGGYLIGGDYQQIGGDEDEYVIKVDSLGNMQWQRYLGGIYDDGNAFVIQLSDGNYAVGGTLTFNQPGGPGVGNPYGKANIVKLDQSGATIWSKTYGSVAFNTTITSLIELSDGSLVGAGFSGGSSTMDGFVLKVDSSGDSLFLRSYNFYWNNHDYFYDIKATNDNGFIMAGRTLNNQWNSWVVKTDSLGCDTLGCNLTGIQNTGSGLIDFTVFPNPTNGLITVNFRNFPSEGYRLIITDVLGNAIFSDLIFSENTQINITQAPSGIYLLRVENSDGFILRLEPIIRK